MSQLLADLQHDHENMSRLLDALERQLDIFDQGKIPDYELIGGILDYCLGYPDRFHHPKEDAILERIERDHPDIEDNFDALREEHRLLADLTQRFADVMGQVLQDQEVPRDRIHQTARDFVRHYRHHLSWEEDAFFPRAAETLTTAEWSAIEAQFPSTADPVFGSGEEARFKRLRGQLLAFERDRDE